MAENEILDAGLANPKPESLNPSTYAYPLHIKFKIGTIYNDLTITDNDGKYIGYVRQKLFKLKDHVQIYSDDTKTAIAYEVKADKIAGLNVCYAFTNHQETPLGKVARKGAKSFWKANYLIYNSLDEHEYTIREENPWAKVWDSIAGEIPVINLLTGYFANPKYLVKDNDGKGIARLKKEPSFWSRKFTLTPLEPLNKGDDERILLALVTMALNERRRG